MAITPTTSSGIHQATVVPKTATSPKVIVNGSSWVAPNAASSTPPSSRPIAAKATGGRPSEGRAATT